MKDRVVLRSKEDILTCCVVVECDCLQPVMTEEVIHFLESDSVAKRTRKQVKYVSARTLDGCVAFYVHLKDSLDWLYRLDIVDALQRYFSEKGLKCVVV